MALGDVILGLNPMDLVEGYRKGLELGRERQRGEQAELRTEIMRTRDIPEARRAGQESELSFEAIGAERETELGRRRSGIRTEAGAQTRKEAFGELLTRTQPGRIEFEEQRQEQLRKLIPLRLGIEEAEFVEKGLGQQERMGNARSRMEDQDTITIARDNILAIRQDPAMRDASDYEVLEAAYQAETEPRARELIRRQRDAQAVGQLSAAAVGGNINAMNSWVRRLGKPYELVRESVRRADGTERPVISAYRTETVVQPDGTMVTQRVGDAVSQFVEDDPNDARFVANALPEFLGYTRPQQQTRGRAPARTTAARKTAAPKTKPPGPTEDAKAQLGGQTAEQSRRATDQAGRDAQMAPMNQRIANDTERKFNAGSKTIPELLAAQTEAIRTNHQVIIDLVQREILRRIPPAKKAPQGATGQLPIGLAASR